MSEQRSLDDMLSSAEGMTDVEIHRLKCERVLGATAIMLHERGHTDASGLLAEVTSEAWCSNCAGETGIVA